MARAQNVDMFLMKRKLYEKITKRALACKYYAHTYNVEILIYFNPELEVKNTKSAISNKLKDLKTELKEFKFATTLVLEFKNIESDDKTKYNISYSTSKQTQLLKKVILIVYLKQFIVKSCQI